MEINQKTCDNKFLLTCDFLPPWPCVHLSMCLQEPELPLFASSKRTSFRFRIDLHIQSLSPQRVARAAKGQRTFHPAVHDPPLRLGTNTRRNFFFALAQQDECSQAVKTDFTQRGLASNGFEWI